MQLQERERQRDLQDVIERHVYAELNYVDGAGATVRVQGTGTEDEECAVLNIGGVSFNLEKGSNTEVILLSGGSDTTLKLALLTIPRDKQRQWAENTGGIQHPTDPERALEFNAQRTWMTDQRIALGPNGEIEIINGTVYIRGPLVIEGQASTNTRFKAANPAAPNGTTPIPGWVP